MNGVWTIAPLCISLASYSPNALSEERQMDIQLTINNDTQVHVVLENNPTAQSLYNQLPLTVQVRDFAGTEKASDPLPQKLSTEGAPKGYTPQAGDLTYYAPWGNLAFFHKPDGHAKGLIFLGQLKDNAPHVLQQAHTITLTK